LLQARHAEQVCKSDLVDGTPACPVGDESIERVAFEAADRARLSAEVAGVKDDQTLRVLQISEEREAERSGIDDAHSGRLRQALRERLGRMNAGAVITEQNVADSKNDRAFHSTSLDPCTLGILPPTGDGSSS